VFGRPDATAFARALGVALQRTNVLRDVAADARVGRVYVPAEDLARAGVDAAELAGADMPPRFRSVARALARRARAAFAAAHAAVPPGAERALAPALGMGRVYAAVLSRLEADPPRAWTTRVRLPKFEAALRGLGLLGGGR
jgi:phytoene synthase